MLRLASDLSYKSQKLNIHKKHFYHAAIGLRYDGCLVSSVNGAPEKPCREHHAETRLCRKLNYGSIVYVARTLKDGTWANSLPCRPCKKAMYSVGVVKIYYTIAPGEYGCIRF